MRILFEGAAGTTTGSMHLIEVNGKRIMLDCGLFQGKRKEAFERNRHIAFDPPTVDVCVLSHAHIDHSGNLPSLVKNGFRGPIHATPATVDLCGIMLMDSAHLQEMDVKYVNKRRRAQGQNPFEPLYTQDDAQKALASFSPVRYETPTEIAPGVALTYHDAGHILGSAITELNITENGKRTRFLFTGDLGRSNMPILKDPVVVQDVDVLLTESTYGNRLHPKDEDVKQEIVDLCAKVTKRGSRLIIPAFSVGRTQQILYLMHQLWLEGRMCKVPVYIDSPLSTKATEVYARHPECYDKEMLKVVSRSEYPFSFGQVRFTADVAESKALNAMKGPMIVISASGMCEGGRILHHLQRSVSNADNIILIVGYQAEHTLGRRIVERSPVVTIYGEEHPLRAEVHSIQALSGHADRNELLDYFRKMGPKVKHAFVVHGEAEQSQALAGALRELGAGDVVVPGPGQSADI